SGLHTNGYSLARRLLFQKAGYNATTHLPEIGGDLGDALLAVHRSYLKPLRSLIAASFLHGAAHITGGGITDNLPRVLPPALAAMVDTSCWKIPPIFEILRRLGNIPEDDYRRTFNLGVGIVFAVPRRHVIKAERLLARLGETPFSIGEVIEYRRGHPRVQYR
ncbi:MAG: phosphoribosylformylglycinamidine cyclo-ligase, partial [Acidobacteriia bacterium]|nr:phosphoribosylformylglycinamidine cyclo-ligase [Terriglobia bacterium]